MNQYPMHLPDLTETKSATNCPTTIPEKQLYLKKIDVMYAKLQQFCSVIAASVVITMLMISSANAQTSDEQTGNSNQSDSPADSAEEDRDISDEPRDKDRTLKFPTQLPFPSDPTIFDGSVNGASILPCWHIVGCNSDKRSKADTQYLNCNSSLIDSIALSHNTGGTRYETIHVDYNWRVRLAFAQPKKSAVVATLMYRGMLDCLNRHYTDPDVRSWNGIWQQLHCHVFYQIGGGATWDLEGHRGSNWVGYLAITSRCNH